MTPSEDDVPRFKPLGTYEVPSMPTQETLNQLLARLYGIFRRDEAPLMAEDRLRKTTQHLLDEVVAPPACGPLLRELDATLAEWVTTPQPRSWLQLIVMPPCEENGFVEAWAREHDYDVLTPPARSDLLTQDDVEPADLAGAGVLVIPRVEHWFLRHHGGLRHVRLLLEQLSRCERHCVIGCNTWAWNFLRKAAGADVLLPTPLSSKAFNGERLRAWFTELANHESTASFVFRLPGSGVDVLAVDDEGKPQSEYFQTLAANSLGIPWVAWHLWRNSLRSDEDTESGEAEERDSGAAESGAVDKLKPDKKTLWVAALDQFTLPNGGGQGSLQVLQALLIHGQLSAQELQRVLPTLGETHVLPALIATGFVSRDGDLLRCQPSAYPSIRSGLRSAGFSMAAL